jgi:putative redox protein
MIVNLVWKEKMQFVSSVGSHEVTMDAKAPIGQNQGQTPKELLVDALCGCTAMDVIAWLRKNKQTVEHFAVQAEVSVSEKGHPAVFTAAHLLYKIEGEVIASIAEQAVRLSQSQYCGVSAMLAKAFPITWELLVNGASVAKGEAAFP